MRRGASNLDSINHRTKLLRVEVQFISGCPYLIMVCNDKLGYIAGTAKPIELDSANAKITDKDTLSAILSLHKETVYQKYIINGIISDPIKASYNLYIPEDTVVEYVYVHKYLNLSIFRMKSNRLITVGSICEYFEDPSDDQFDKIYDKCAIAEYIWTHKEIIKPLLNVDSVADKARAAYNITV